MEEFKAAMVGGFIVLNQRFSDLEARVGAVEKLQDGLQRGFDGLSTEFKDLKSDVKKAQDAFQSELQGFRTDFKPLISWGYVLGSTGRFLRVAVPVVSVTAAAIYAAATPSPLPPAPSGIRTAASGKTSPASGKTSPAAA